MWNYDIQFLALEVILVLVAGQSRVFKSSILHQVGIAQLIYKIHREVL